MVFKPIFIGSKLPDLKTLHAGWIVNLHNHMQGECETIVKGFKEAGTVEAIKDSEAIFRRLYQYFFIFEEKRYGQES